MSSRPPLINIHWPEETQESKRKALSAYSLFALAFRPFFLFGACWALLAIRIWALWFSGLMLVSVWFSCSSVARP